MQQLGRAVFELENKPTIISYGAIAGKKESEGPLGDEFDETNTDSLFGQNTFEKAESHLQKRAVEIALSKGNLKNSDIDLIYAGDLLNQCIGSSFGLRDLEIPFIGLYGACSTMALSLAMAAISINSGMAKHAVAVTSSHFCSAERQYRFPLEYGGQRTPTAQWTVTGSGAAVVSKTENKPYIKRIAIGKIMDLGIKDANNMGAAMAPDDVKIRPYPRHEGMVFFYTQIQYLRGFRALFKNYQSRKISKKLWTEINTLCIK